MAFALAQAYVELSNRGFSAVLGGIGSIKTALTSLISPTSLVSSAIGALGVGVGVGSMLKIAADAETLSTSFEVLLAGAKDVRNELATPMPSGAVSGGAAPAIDTTPGERAKQMMEDINRFAAETPYEQAELGGVAKQLLAFGVAGEQVIGTMRQLGDIASLSGARLGDLALVYGKIKQVGKADMESLKQFAERGIGVVDELARAYGKTPAEIFKMASQGQIGFEQVEYALQSLTAEGGLFAGGMARLATTTAGIWSTLTGDLKTLLGQIGALMIEGFDLKGVMSRMDAFVGSFMANYGDKIKAVFAGIATAIRIVWSGIYDVAGRISTALGNAIPGDAFDGPVASLLSSISPVLGPIGALADSVWNVLSSVGAAVASILPDIVQFVASLLPPILRVVSAITGWIRDHSALITSLLKLGAIIAGVILAIKGVVVVVGAVSAAFAFLCTPIGWVTAAVAVLALIFPETFKSILGGLWNLIVNWDIAWRLAWEYTKLAFSNMWERIKTWCINVGEITVWVWDNFGKLAYDTANWVAIVFQNLGKNIMAIWEGVKNFFSTGRFDVDWTSLTEGFKSTVSAFPALTKAQIHATNAEIDRLNAELARRTAPKAKAETADKTATEVGAASRAAPPAPGAPPPLATGKPAKEKTTKEKTFEFVGIAQLAEKMQQEAAKQNDQKRQTDAAEKAAEANQRLLDQAQGPGLRVQVVNGSGPAPAAAVFAA